MEIQRQAQNLEAAFGQLQQYALALESPPLLVVCDLDRFVIRTAWSSTVSEKHEFGLEDLRRDPHTLEKLKWVMSDPEKLRPGKTRQDLTEDAAGEFAALAQNLRTRGHEPSEVAHFINRLVFCMLRAGLQFAAAEDVYAHDDGGEIQAGRIPETRIEPIRRYEGWRPNEVSSRSSGLTAAYSTTTMPLPLTADDITLCLRAAALDWSEIDHSIFGTLFVRGLDPDKRSETGAEYTDRGKIMMIVEPVITPRYLLREWEAVRSGIVSLPSILLGLRSRKLSPAASGYPELAEEVKTVRKPPYRTTPARIVQRPHKTKARSRTLDAVRGSLRAADRALTEAKEQGRAAFQHLYGATCARFGFSIPRAAPETSSILPSSR